MAISCTAGGVVLDTPDDKVFDIDVPEADPVDTGITLTFVGGGMVNLRAIPAEVFLLETTDFAAGPTVSANVAINTVTTTGFNVVKTSLAVANAVVHTWHVYIHTRRFDS